MQWLAFGLSGAFAGLAGGLWAHLRGSVFPTVLAVPQSVDGLVMVMLIGVAQAGLEQGDRLDDGRSA